MKTLTIILVCTMFAVLASACYEEATLLASPQQPTMTVTNVYEIYFTQGEVQQAQINISTENLPNGTYKAYINRLPQGMYVAGWSEAYKYVWDSFTEEYESVRTVYGEVEIIDGAGTFTLASDYTFGPNALPLTSSFELNLENVVYGSRFEVDIKPTIVDIQFYTNRYTRRPGSGRMLPFFISVYCMYESDAYDDIYDFVQFFIHQRLMDFIDWSVTGMVEGDYFDYDQYMSPERKTLYIGPSTEKRTVIVTASASNNQDIYATVAIRVGDGFEFTPAHIFLSPRNEPEEMINGLQFSTNLGYVVLDDYNKHEAYLWIMVIDDYNRPSISTENISFLVESTSAHIPDILIIDDYSITFNPWTEPTVRLVTITASYYPYAYDYINILVVPSANYLPYMYIADFDNYTVTLHAKNIPDGYHQIFLSVFNVWDRDELVEFVDGVGIVILDDDDIVLSDFYSYFLDFYWKAWIEEFGIMPMGMGYVVLG